MTINPLSFAVVVTGVGQHIVNTLAATPGATNPGRIALLVPGADIAADGCDCGAFAQAIQRENPTRVFPIDSSAEPTVACADPSMMATVFAMVFSCTPALRQIDATRIVYPSPQALYDSAINQQIDAYVLRRAALEALCQAKTSRLITAFKVGALEFPGPEGACKSVMLTYAFQVV
jgi:hypothetical protein